MAAISTALIGAAALGVTAYGTSQSISGARSSAAAQQQQIQEELKAEALRKRAMEVDARRKQMEMLRNQQRARAMALTAATSQGAQAGSGLQGGYGQISGATGNNLQGVDNSLQFGSAMFGINSNISQARMGIAAGQSQMATGQAFTGLGGSLMASMGAIKSISGGFGAGSMFSPSQSYGGGYGMNSYGGQMSAMGYGGQY